MAYLQGGPPTSINQLFCGLIFYYPAAPSDIRPHPVRLIQRKQLLKDILTIIYVMNSNGRLEINDNDSNNKSSGCKFPQKPF